MIDIGFGMKTLVVGPLDVNCYLLWSGPEKLGVVVDPGGDVEEIEKAVRSEGLSVRYIINTHGHFDHVGGNGELSEALDVPVAIHPADVPLVEGAHIQGGHMGVPTAEQPSPSVALEDCGEIRAGELVVKILHTPGHSPGGVCLYVEDEGVLITGDTLFAGSVGRTDLPGGSFDALMASIREVILPLGDEVRIFPGHGSSSTIGEEKEINPFITGRY